MAGCQEYQKQRRELPLAENVVPLPVLCKQAKLSDDPRVVALSNRYCAVANQQRLVSAKVAYEKIRQCYSGGNCE
jgi:hypothetical protein